MATVERGKSVQKMVPGMFAFQPRAGGLENAQHRRENYAACGQPRALPACLFFPFFAADTEHETTLEWP